MFLRLYQSTLSFKDVKMSRLWRTTFRNFGYKFIHESVFPRIVQFPRRPPSIDPQKYERTTFPLFQLHIYISRENLRGWSTVKHAIVQREVDSQQLRSKIFTWSRKNMLGVAGSDVWWARNWTKNREKKLLLHWLSPNKDPSITFSCLHSPHFFSSFPILKNPSKIIGDPILRHWINN